MFDNAYDRKIKAEVMAINKRYIKQTGDVGGAFLGRPIGGGLSCTEEPKIITTQVIQKGRKGGAKSGGAKSGGAKRAVSPWISHVKQYAASHNMSYRDALKDPGCKASYKKGDPVSHEVVETKAEEKKAGKPAEPVKGKRPPSKWITHVKDFAKRNNVSYGCALSMPECKAEYRNPKVSEAPKKKRLIRKAKVEAVVEAPKKKRLVRVKNL